MRELCGLSWRPREVLLPRARPADERPYAEYFRCPVHYDSDRAAIRIAPGDLARDVKSANAARKRALEVELAPRLDEDLVLRLQRSLRILLVDDAASKEFVAQHFAMHRRTLERRLNARGITFQAVLDEVRFEVARQLLHDTQLAIANIAGAIGFEEASSFTRAFTRWAGVSPTKWRSAQRPPA
jgi:AraC-like DNA-binding protein